MIYTNQVKTIFKYVSIIIFISITICNSNAQVNANKLSNNEVNEILYKIDTLTGDRNYHVLLKPENNNTFQVYIWINNRLGETMFKEVGMRICRFYTCRESLVFIYEYRQCKCEVSSNFLRRKTSNQYSYLSESPFYVDGGFHQAYLVKRNGSTVEFSKLEFVNESEDLRGQIGY